MSEYAAFNYDGIEQDRARGVLFFKYSYSPDLRFVEEIDFGCSLPASDSPRYLAFQEAVQALYILCGISYYKMYVPHELRASDMIWDVQQRAFYEDTFREGLGEFAHRNAIDLSGRISFTLAPAAVPSPSRHMSSRLAQNQDGDRPGASLVLMGGGKDSLVSAEVLRRAGLPFSLFTVNPRSPMIDSAVAGNLELITAYRRLDPRLFRMNGLPGVFNGHIPITAIVSLIAVCCAIIHGYSNVILSNERSADEPTILRGDKGINHQYSKSSDFEERLAAFVKYYISQDISYFSLLRPLSEFHIAHLFSRVSRYDESFTSCNRAFTLDQSANSRWCLSCAKCRFTFLMLAVWLPKARLLRIFGADLLSDLAQQRGFEEVLGLEADKPWDCVGEVAESRAAMVQLAGRTEWSGARVVRALAPRALASGPAQEAILTDLMVPRWTRMMPPAFAEALHAYL